MGLSVGDVAGDASTLTSDWINAAHRRLQGSQHDSLNLLAADIGLLTTEIPLTYPLNAVRAGTLLSVDLEVMYVWEVNDAATTATVQRGWQGSTPAAHATETLVTVNPRYTDWAIFDALNSELRSLSVNGIYQIRTADITAESGRLGYDLSMTGFLSIAEIRWQLPGTVSKEWPELTDYTVDNDLPTSDFPSGTALFLTGELPAAQQTIRIRYRAALGALANLYDDVQIVTGVPATALDIPPLGAALRLAAGRPVGRSQYDAQGDTRRPDEVRVGDVLQAPSALRLEYQQRISEEAGRLRQQWPSRSRPRVHL